MTAALVGLICVAVSAAILISLHFLPTGLDPIRYAVSDYGWTAYHLGYRAMVVPPPRSSRSCDDAPQVSSLFAAWIHDRGVVTIGNLGLAGCSCCGGRRWLRRRLP
jgi:hypothetical protein